MGIRMFNFFLLLMFGLTVLVVMYISDHLGMTASVMHKAPAQRRPLSSVVSTIGQQETLAEYVWGQCQKQGVERPPPLRSISDHIFVEDKHKVLYCNVPKVACSNWRRVLLVMSGHVNASRMMDIKPHSPTDSKHLTPLSAYNRSATQYRLNNYFKFMMVRDPLERLLSAWRNKFQANSTKSIRYRRKYVEAILQQYPAVRSRLNDGSERIALDKVMIRFNEFLRFVVDTHKNRGKLDIHWDHYHHRCHPCSVHYDFVGRYDRLEVDAAHVLKMVNADHEVRFPERSLGYKHNLTSLYINEYYRNVPPSLLKQIVDLYEADFTFFNFSVSKYLKF